MCVYSGSVHFSSMEYECSHQNEKASSFITAVIECNLPAIGVSLTQCICPSRYGSVQDLGLRSTLSAQDHHVKVSCVRSLAGRLQYLCVISSYELLRSGLELSVGSSPSRPKHSLSSHGQRGERGEGEGWGFETLLNILLSRKKRETSHTCACAAQRKCPANPQMYSK